MAEGLGRVRKCSSSCDGEEMMIRLLEEVLLRVGVSFECMISIAKLI